MLSVMVCINKERGLARAGRFAPAARPTPFSAFHKPYISCEFSAGTENRSPRAEANLSLGEVLLHFFPSFLDPESNP